MFNLKGLNQILGSGDLTVFLVVLILFTDFKDWIGSAMAQRYTTDTPECFLSNLMPSTSSLFCEMPHISIGRPWAVQLTSHFLRATCQNSDSSHSFYWLVAGIRWIRRLRVNTVGQGNGSSSEGRLGYQGRKQVRQNSRDDTGRSGFRDK